MQKIFDAKEEEIAGVYRFAETLAHTLVEGIQENKEEMQSLVSSGTLSVVEGAAQGKLAGKSFCFTGELSMKRQDAQNLVKQNGGAVKSSVVKGLSYLVTNDTSSGSSKNKKAMELGIPVIDEKEFLALIEA